MLFRSDSLERFFFAVCPIPAAASSSGPSTAPVASAGSKVLRVALYAKTKDDFGHDLTDAVGGGGRGEVESVSEGTSYTVPCVVSALSARAQS